MTPPLAIVDVDGTLVDSNYHHALCWAGAFQRHGVTIPLWRIHRAIGMGGDQIVPALAGQEVAGERGDAIRDAHAELFAGLVDGVRPLPGARRFLEALAQRGHDVVLASSAKQAEVDRYLDLLGARDVVGAWTTSADVEATKPDPDVVHAAMDRAGRRDAVMVGDSVHDVTAALRAGLPTYAVLTGGHCRGELCAAGARAVYPTLDELCEDLGALSSGA